MIRRILLVLLLCLPAWATNRTVKKGGGGDYTTITACIAAMSSGDTCTVYGTPTIADGDYSSEGTHTIAAGGASAYRTLTVNTGDTVTTKEWTLNSHTKLIGFSVQDTAAPNSLRCVTLANSSTDIYITSNTFYACANGAGGVMLGPTPAAGTASYIYIQSNTFSYPCSTSGSPDVCKFISAQGDHWLIELNDFSHGNTPIVRNGSYGVVRNNTYHTVNGRDPAGVGLPAVDCIPTFSSNPSVTIDGAGVVTWVSGGTFSNFYPGAWVKISGTPYTVSAVASATSMTLGGSPPTGAQTLVGGNGNNCHSNFFLSTPASTTQYNLVEGNVLLNLLGSDAKGFLFQGNSCGGNCNVAIIRFNQGAHIGSGIYTDDNSLSSTPNPSFLNVKAYNNTWADALNYSSNFNGGSTGAFVYNSWGGAVINEIFHYTHSTTGTNAYQCNNNTAASNTCVDTAVSHGSYPTFVHRNNLAWATGATKTIYGRVYGQGAFTDEATNVKVDPAFTNYSATLLGDLRATATETHLTGGYLTTVNGAVSNSVTVVVVDASFFSDGFGLVLADWLCFGDTPLSSVSTNCGQISSINYATNTLTMTAPMTIANGAKVWLYKDSNGRVVLTSTSTQAPNIGAFPDSVSPSTIAFGNQQTGTTSAAQIVTLSNWTLSTMTYTSAALSGANAADFTISANTCSSPLAAAAVCLISVEFTPQTNGAGKTATLTITDGASDSPQTVALSGTAAASPNAPVASLNCTPSPGLVYGGSWTCTPTTTGGTTCNRQITMRGIHSQADQIIDSSALPDCSSAFTVTPTGFERSYQLCYVATNSNGSTAACHSVDTYTQKAVSAGRIPY